MRGIHPVDSLHKVPVMQSCDDIFAVIRNILVHKWLSCQWSMMPRCSCDITVMGTSVQLTGIYCTGKVIITPSMCILRGAMTCPFSRCQLIIGVTQVLMYGIIIHCCAIYIGIVFAEAKKGHSRSHNNDILQTKKVNLINLISLLKLTFMILSATWWPFCIDIVLSRVCG